MKGMEVIQLIFIILGVLVSMVGGVMGIVVAFRRSFLWGVAWIFVPFAALIFLRRYWAEARTSFLVTLLGALVMWIGYFLNPEPFLNAEQGRGLSERIAKNRASSLVQGSTTKIEGHRERLFQLQREAAQVEVEAKRQFQVLTAKRNALKLGDAVAVTKFNEEAVVYQKQNEKLKQARQELATANQNLSDLLTERSKLIGASGLQRPGSRKRIVMYTTAYCPACKVAKAYFAKKGLAYEDNDVDQSRAAAEEFMRLGGRGVPLIIIGDQRMEGFDSQKLEAML